MTHSLDYIYAKPDETLRTHTERLLLILAQWRQQRPPIEGLIIPLDEIFWWHLAWACILHDVGKLAQGFQDAMLHGDKDNQWRREHHRHEVLSLVWVGRLWQSDPLIGATIATHHRDWTHIRHHYGGNFADSEQKRARDFLVSQIIADAEEALNTWLVTEVPDLLAHYGFTGVLPQWRDLPASQSLDQTLASIAQYQTQAPTVSAHILRGLLMHVDHSASAGVTTLPELSLPPAIWRDLPSHRYYSHQRRLSQQADDVLLVAPTGLGKTEASLLWAVEQQQRQPSARLYYVLPYQTSMNAMARRLSLRLHSTAFESDANQQIALLHSRIAQIHYQTALDDGASKRQAYYYARKRRDWARLSVAPLQVCSPYQLLKAVFGLRGQSILWANMLGARFILDEIHAYEPTRSGMLLALIAHLKQHYGAQFCIMTATLPPPLRHALQAILPDAPLITPTPDEYARAERHRLHLHQGDIMGTLPDAITRAQQGQRVLVTCNQVNRAQTVYRTLRQSLHDAVPVMLLHGRFHDADRGRIEAELMQRAGVGAPRCEQGLILVATQTVEVSLDIDFDCLYTEPAPLEALLQRFGRVNRGRATPIIAPVFVCTLPIDEEGALPYQASSLVRTLDLLGDHQGHIIREANITTWLEHIYADEYGATWQDQLITAQTQTHNLLSQQRAFEDAPKTIALQFYKLFDGRDVLPVDCLDAYYDALEDGDFIGAHRYAVPIRWRQYHRLKDQGLLIEDDENDLPQVHVPYDEEGLRLDWDALV